MKCKAILGVLFVLALILTACAPAPAAAPTATTEPTMAPTEAPVTEAPAVAGAATVQVSEAEGFGPILVDGNGLSLYVFMADTQDAGTSACSDDCAVEWPPLVTEGSPVAGEGMDDAMLGTITRDDGSMQVTYHGWPLYLFEEDLAAGDTNGQGLEEFGGLWFLVSPEGEAIQQ